MISSMQISEENLKALREFAVVAADFCRFIESFREGRPDHLYTQMEKILQTIHQAILPVEIEMAEGEHPEFDGLKLSHQQWQELYRVIDGIVRPESSTLSEFHKEIAADSEQTETCDATRAWMFSDDLADIYRDLYRGLALWETDTPEGWAEAAWEWRFNYGIHWGEHLFRAMLTVHEVRYQLHEH